MQVKFNIMTKNFFKKNFYEIWIATRYTRLKNTNNFISFISLTSIIGITLGVMALIVVLSVMNGFQSELKERILSVASHLEITKPGSGIRDWESLQLLVNKQSDVKASAPFVNNQAMISVGKYSKGVIVRGISPKNEIKVSDLNLKIKEGAYKLKKNEFNILIGSDLAKYFRLSVGDKVTLMITKGNYSPAGMVPRFKRFTISGIFEVGMYEYDSSFTLININDAQKLFQLGQNVSGLRVKLFDLDKTESISRKLQSNISSYNGLYISDWTRKHANLFSAIQMEKRVMFVILTLIIAVAAFNIVSTLVMGVTEKKTDIAILRTLGATQKSILLIFIAQGSIIGVVGTIFGIIFGVLISINIDVIIPFIEGIFGINFLSKDIYYISNVPSQLLINDIYKIAFMGLILSFLATIYPSYKASKIDPASALKYE